MHKVDQGSVVNAGDSNIDDNPTICEYWVGLWECVARSNPQVSKSEAFDPDIIPYENKEGEDLVAQKY